MKSILDPSFRYVPAVQTDIRKTFARIKRELLSKQKSLGSEIESILIAHRDELYDPHEEARRIVRPIDLRKKK